MSAAEPAGGRRRPARADLLTIGEVLAELHEDFPDTTHSKVRFLEERGLVTPARTPSGYRKFSREHLARLRLVLTLQRDRYLPLKVIAEHLAALDAGAQPHLPPAQPATTARPATAGQAARPPRAAAPTAPPAPATAPQPRPAPHSAPTPAPTAPAPAAAATTPVPSAGRTAPAAPPDAPGAPTARPAGAPAPRAPLDPAEVVALAGGDAALVSALGDHGLLPPAHDGAATTTVVRAAATLASFGIEPRHLRALRTAAEREATLIEAVAAPLRRARTAGAARDAAAVAGEQIQEAFADLRAGLLRAALTSPP